jgi:hypothetical protein
MLVSNLDEFEQKLEQKLIELKQCQDKSSKDDCFECSSFFECKLRKEYVNAVYDSMNKGSTGGFDF